MARMIPKWVHAGAPASERRVFEKLELDPAAGNWTVLHSLGLSRRRSGPYGEIDFVVIVPDEGVVCLEVKGGRVSCENGVWRTRNRRGEAAALQSPFMQARNNVARRFARGSSRKDEFEEKDKAIRESGEHDLNKVGFDETYAEYGTFGLEERGAPFDVLVVDEAQDVLWSRHVLRFLDAALRGGLAGGRWAVFGDFNRQAVRPNVPPFDPAEVLPDRGFVRARLLLNCRNSRSIAEATAVVTGVESRIGKPDSTVPELGVEHHFCGGNLDLAALLTRTVERLTREGTPVEDVVVLSPCRLDDRQKSGLAGIERIAGHPLRPAEQGADVEPGSLRYSTIGRFKGLESNVVILVNVDAMEGERNESLLYVGMTRARALLVFLVADTPRARRVWEPRFREMARSASSPGRR